jgi:hypothetical protein
LELLIKSFTTGIAYQIFFFVAHTFILLRALEGNHLLINGWMNKGAMELYRAIKK